VEKETGKKNLRTPRQGHWEKGLPLAKRGRMRVNLFPKVRKKGGRLRGWGKMKAD